MMFNLAHLNDYEFELLCKDIMERKLACKLHTFAKGRDGGVDICDSKKDINIMIQVKHYIGSSYSMLITQLKKEVLKVKKNNPKEYYLCFSLEKEISLDNKRQILDIFKDCNMHNISHIIDKTEINDFLSKKENSDIVEKNFKLWLCSSNVLQLINNQDVFIDCCEIIKDIEEQSSLFVKTKAYDECLTMLNKKNIVIITGEPGVGKSTISKMLLLKFADSGYCVKYASNNDVSKIKNSISKNPEVKEIVLLDDFLGQHYLKINNNQPNEIKYLISYIERSTNKKLILNSRIHILNDAKKKSIDFNSVMEKQDNNKYLIDLNKMNVLEKAKILYNHLYFNNIPVEYFENIRLDKKYLKIVRHENYNPRIIEYVTNKCNYEKVLPINFFEYVIEKLDNPDSVWEDDFNNRLEDEDRIFMYTLYSLTDNLIEQDVLEESFNKRIFSYEKYKYKTTKNIFIETLNRLSDALIKIICDKNTIKVSVVNPSVNDYIKTTLKSNDVEQCEIIKNSSFIDQVLRMPQSTFNQAFQKKLITGDELFNLKTLEDNIFYYYLFLTFRYSIYDKKRKDQVNLAFLNFHNSVTTSNYNSLFLDIMNTDFFTYYDLNVNLDNKNCLKNILEELYLDSIVELFNTHKKFNKMIIYNQSIINIYKEKLSFKISDKILDNINLELEQIVANEISNNDKESKINSTDNLYDYYVEMYKDNIENIINSEISNNFDNLVTILPQELMIDFNEIDKWYINSNTDINRAISSFIEGEMEESYISSYIEDRYEFDNTEQIINEMFRKIEC